MMVSQGIAAQTKTGSAVSSVSVLITAAAVGVVAYGAADVIHEVGGHALVAYLLGMKIVSVSTVAVQTGGSNRWMVAAGGLANLLAGLLASLLFHRSRGFSKSRYFFWLMACVNLMMFAGYLMYSAVFDTGDWSVVISALRPSWIWRAVMFAGGVGSYIGAMRLVSAAMIRLVSQGLVGRNELFRLALIPYFAGGLLWSAASYLNPISPSLFWVSGISSFASMIGLLRIPWIVRERVPEHDGTAPAFESSGSWVVAALLVAAVFIGVLGPGIRFP